MQDKCKTIAKQLKQYAQYAKQKAQNENIKIYARYAQIICNLKKYAQYEKTKYANNYAKYAVYAYPSSSSKKIEAKEQY